MWGEHSNVIEGLCYLVAGLAFIVAAEAGALFFLSARLRRLKAPPRWARGGSFGLRRFDRAGGKS